MLEWMFSCCSTYIHIIYIHTMYFFYYTPRPELCKELHSVLSTSIPINHQISNDCSRLQDLYLSYTHLKSFVQKRLVCFTELRKWSLVASISKNKHCSCTMKIPTSWKFQRMALSRTFKYASPSLFLRRPVFTLILFGVVVCILVCMYLGNKSYVASIIFITSRRSESRPKTPIFTRAM